MAQKDLANPNFYARETISVFGDCVGLLATILLRACEHKDIHRYASAIRNALHGISATFPKGESYSHLYKLVDLSEIHIAPIDFAPLQEKLIHELAMFTVSERKKVPKGIVS